MYPQDNRKTKSENQTLQKLCLNRKKQNFEALKSWDQKRAQRLITHRRVANEIDSSLQNRLSQSDDFLKVVLQFLQDSEEQKKKYQIQNVKNPQQKLKANSVSRNIHRNTSRALVKLFATTQNFKNIRKLRTILENGRNQIQNILLDCKRDVMEIRTKIQLTALEIQNANERTIQKCDQVALIYNKDKNAKPLQAEADFFAMQHQFIIEAQEQTQIQRRFGEETVQYIDNVEDYEKKKLFIVKQILQTYIETLSQQNEENETLKFLIDILKKKTQDQYISMLYSSQQLVKHELLQEIRRIQSKHASEKIDIRYVKNFLKKLNFIPFDSRHLILKQYRAFIKVGEELENSYIIFTIDAFINIYTYTEEFSLSESETDLKFQLNSDLQMNPEGDINILIVLRKWQLLKFGKENIEEFTLVFANEDQRDEFLEFAGKMTK